MYSYMRCLFACFARPVSHQIAKRHGQYRGLNRRLAGRLGLLYRKLLAPSDHGSGRIAGRVGLYASWEATVLSDAISYTSSCMHVGMYIRCTHPICELQPVDNHHI